MNKSKLTFRRSDVHAYLEEKIHWDEETDEEYGFYIALRDQGYKVFEFDEHKKVIKKLLREMKEYWS